MFTAALKRARLRLNPDRLAIGLLAVVCLLWMSERFQWLALNHHKGFTVLAAAALAGVAAVIVLLRLLAGLAFRWRFQFGLRAMLVLVAVFSVVAAWFAAEWKAAQGMQAMVKAVHALGGSAEYREVDIIRTGPGMIWEATAAVNSGNFFEAPVDTSPEWLRGVLGRAFFADGFSVDLSNTKVDDAELARIAENPAFASTRYLRLSNTQVTDSAFSQIERFQGLKGLNVAGTKITDRGLHRIEALTRLEYLDISNTVITDNGFRAVRPLTHLTDLSLSRTQISDRGLQNLEGLRALESLECEDMKITDAGLKSLAGLTNLHNLNLSKTGISGCGMHELKRLAQLQDLNLGDNSLIGDGLQDLGALTKLEDLDMQHVELFVECLNALQKALPDGVITWSPPLTSRREHAQFGARKMTRCALTRTVGP